MVTSTSVKEFGTTGEGVRLETKAIQDAIDACSVAGGGVVEFPPGRYRTGTFFIKDNVTLQLNKDAVILGSEDIEHYENPDAYVDATGQNRGWALIAALDAHNIGITGEGIIDGCGGVFAGTKKRPMLLRVLRCTGVQIEGVTLLDSGSWVSHYFLCRDVSIRNITIRSDCAKNNDGIDIDSSEDVTITGCTVDTGDDAICLKTTCEQPCRNVVVSDCDLSSHWGPIKLGTESMGDMEHIRVSNCRIHHARGGGIKILGMDGANIQDVVLEDITMLKVDMPIFIKLGRRMRTYRPDDPVLQPGSIRKLTIRNLQAVMKDDTMVSPPTGIFIDGLSDRPLKDLTLENISISHPGGGTPKQAELTPDPRETEYPEYSRFGVLPAYGVYCRHARNVRLSNCQFDIRTPDGRPDVHLQDTHSPGHSPRPEETPSQL